MFIILVYDINKKRVSLVHKICKKYLYVVQKSVFEGEITQKELDKLQKELIRLVDVKQDSICIYRFESKKYASKIQIGQINDSTNIL